MKKILILFFLLLYSTVSADTVSFNYDEHGQIQKASFLHNGAVLDYDYDSIGNRETFEVSIPLTVSTALVTSITSTTASSGGDVTSDGGSTVIARGVCWDTTINPTIDDPPFTTDGTGTGSFTSSITNLIPETTYYVRAYATNSDGISYGNELTFTTSSASNCPDCSGTVVSIENFTFEDGVDCECNADSITIGPGVIVENGARVRLNAPEINFEAGVTVEEGADFQAGQ